MPQSVNKMSENGNERNDLRDAGGVWPRKLRRQQGSAYSEKKPFLMRAATIAVDKPPSSRDVNPIIGRDREPSPIFKPVYTVDPIKGHNVLDKTQVFLELHGEMRDGIEISAYSQHYYMITKKELQALQAKLDTLQSNRCSIM